MRIPDLRWVFGLIFFVVVIFIAFWNLVRVIQLEKKTFKDIIDCILVMLFVLAPVILFVGNIVVQIWEMLND